jgi:hypothetical protein
MTIITVTNPNTGQTRTATNNNGTTNWIWSITNAQGNNIPGGGQIGTNATPNQVLEDLAYPGDSCSIDGHQVNNPRNDLGGNPPANPPLPDEGGDGGGGGGGEGDGGGGEGDGGGGGEGGGDCFTKETLVLMADGTLRRIEDIKVGDQVLSVDEKTGVEFHCNVKSNIAREVSKTISFTLSTGETLITTPRQSFLHAGGYSMAESLSSGIRLHSRSASAVSIKDKEISQSPQMMWSTKLQQGKTFFVSSNHVPTQKH